MDDLEKSRIRMLHWIEHNIDHMSGYQEVAAILDSAGFKEAAKRIRTGIDAIRTANECFEAAIMDLPGSDVSHHDHSHHHHDHEK